MDNTSDNGHTEERGPQFIAVDRLRRALEQGRDWATALVEAMALWTLATETYRGRTYKYFIAGEAFDWPILAERLCREVDDLLPDREKEDLLFTGRFPAPFDHARFKDILGTQKYRGYLNYYYGVTVEEALQLVVELEVLKRYASNGLQYVEDHSEDAFRKIYMASKSELLDTFRRELDVPPGGSMDLGEAKEFTYWLFKHRLKISDKARIASDTRKGLEQLERMRKAAQRSEPTPRVDHESFIDGVRLSI